MPAIEVPMGIVEQEQIPLANAVVASAAAMRANELVAALFEIIGDLDAKAAERMKAVQILLDAEDRILDREERTRARLEKEAEADLRRRAVAALEKMKQGARDPNAA